MNAEISRTRTLVVWCPDWPVVTALKQAGKHPSAAAAVFLANRVRACTAAARSEGVSIGQRRREAQSRCPELVVLHADADRDAREFEAVTVLVESLAPGVEVLRPGMIACPARGPARFFGSEQGAAENIIDAVESLGVECRIGVADALSPAVLAARHSRIIPVGESARFCGDLPIRELAAESAIAPPERKELVNLLQRLGITTFAAFADLPESKVATRFGADAVVAHRLAQGKAERSVSRRHIPTDLTIEQVCDPPLERVDTAAFAARALAERFHQGLASAGLACTRLTISATTERGQELSRTWRCAAPLTPAATADRVRWQLDGWLTASRTVVSNSGSSDLGGPGAITMLTLHPVEAVAAGHIQHGLWGSSGEDDQRAGWALARIQGLLGPESVLSPLASGGRNLSQRVELIPWGQERVPTKDPAAPWPGRLSAPSPTRITVSTPPRDQQISLLDTHGDTVRVTPRGMLSAEPSWCSAATGKVSRIIGWAGPWLLDERWWEKRKDPVLARLQVSLATGPPLLLALSQVGWIVEGTYD
ncbi:DNA polymerase Y family protein [Nakamurella antarctica]|uniref:DNA polymerase Y family protein n=1 Tax=Nakamurella antarctica TaxID=1902245 RepID=A0A3G8ZKS4_9ACTN|nr:DNA polymerase Y family protein [Nakamurella antarctica]AZI57810.1 DNA polymerase Y family protein [Nakamurella antarctica]